MLMPLFALVLVSTSFMSIISKNLFHKGDGMRACGLL